MSRSISIHRQGASKYLLHPEIQRALPYQPNIADVGTGSGLFLLSLNDSLRNVGRLDGFDITTAQLPQVVDLQPIRLHKHDIREPFAPQFHHLYDVVCVRYMSRHFLDPQEWRLIVRNLIQLLKMSGAMQWLEPDVRRFLQPRDALFISAADVSPNDLRDMYGEWLALHSERLSFGVDKLAETLQGHGMEYVQIDAFESTNSQATEDDIRKRIVQKWLIMRSGDTEADPDRTAKAMMEQLLHGFTDFVYNKHDACLFVAWKSKRSALSNSVDDLGIFAME